MKKKEYEPIFTRKMIIIGCVLLMLFMSFMVFCVMEINFNSKIKCSSGNINLNLDTEPFYVSYNNYSNNIQYMFDTKGMTFSETMQGNINMQRKLFIENFDINGIDNMNCDIEVSGRVPLIVALFK